MASAWGKSWGNAWRNAWGVVVTPDAPGGGGGRSRGGRVDSFKPTTLKQTISGRKKLEEIQREVLEQYQNQTLRDGQRFVGLSIPATLGSFVPSLPEPAVFVDDAEVFAERNRRNEEAQKIQRLRQEKQNRMKIAIALLLLK